jgi:1-aminocyclopropane-1-carboxylate synthase
MSSKTASGATDGRTTSFVSYAKPPLSNRAQSLVDASPLPTYIAEHLKRSTDFVPDDPDRYIGLAIAQNLLMWDVLEPQINRNRNVTPASVAYGDTAGSLELRELIASFGSRHIWGRTVDADDVVLFAGAGAILEMLFFVLADPGEGVLVPTPSYAFYWADLETRDELTIVPVHTSSSDGFRLTPELLEAAASRSDVPISVLLPTNPINPTGQIMPPDDVAACIEWARSRGIHIVVNGIYALSTHGDGVYEPLSSIVPIGDDIHEIWAFSKDFAMSGLRSGVLASTNKDVLGAVAGIGYWSIVSGDTQHLLVNMLADDVWVERYLTEMRSRLSRSYQTTTAALDHAGVPYVEADAGLFLLADFRRFMVEPTWAEEDRIWRLILNEANVNLTPGSACQIGEPGFMRICFATEPPEIVASAIGRIGSLLARRFTAETTLPARM